MAASKQLVYIPEINNSTWLLMTKLKQGTCLRDYSSNSLSEDRSYSFDDLEALLSKKGSYSERLPAFSGISYKDKEFWREQISFRNAESGLQSSVDLRRLQERFKDECSTPLNKQNAPALRAVLERWTRNFQCIKNKRQFNHWDNDPSLSQFSERTGIGWTSQLLEHSRRGKKTHYISTCCKFTDFSLVAMELGLGISSKNNLFRPGKKDFIKPDGLALRRNGYFTVIEVKGPQDERGLLGPMLQATCAALAVIAKKQMLKKIALSPGERRPAADRAEIPVQSRSLGIHVLSQAGRNGGPREPWNSEIENACKTIMSAFRKLEYIAYSFVSQNEAKNLTALKTDYLITTDGITKL